MTAPKRVKVGLVQVLAGLRIFPALAVVENLDLGGFSFGRKASKRHERMEEVMEVFPLLRQHSRKRAGMLAGGEQQNPAIAGG